MGNGISALLEQVLSEQADMSAVELFSELQEVGLAGEVGWYRSLMPATPPGPGQQYGFEVDLDSCTGCKACVTACHRRNGLDEGESWRSAGPLGARGPQVITTSCHHCVEPACLAGCPVNAYEKHPITGIVVHLDDQCIGCGYCLMTCPYEVPRFNHRLGIVRKCDMCQGRLSVGEAPACVGACPNAAIRISVVDVTAQLEAARAERFLVGAPAPSISVPSTVYRSKRGLETSGALETLGGTATPPRPGPSERPLVMMLALSQLAVGVALAGAVLEPALHGPGGHVLAGLALLSFVLGAISVGASLAHLGRRRYAWRAVLGWRHSWLSREVLAVGAFVGLSGAWAGASLAVTELSRSGAAAIGGLGTVGAVLGWATAAAGLGVVACSVMVYAATRRRWWRASLNAARFGSSVVIGSMSGLAGVLAWVGGGLATQQDRSAVAVALIVLAGATFAGERLIRLRLRHGGPTGEMQGSSDLLGRQGLRSLSGWRLGCSLAGALVLGDAVALAAPGAARVMAFLGFILIVAGELAGRRIFFEAVAPTRMPGGRA